MIAVLGAAAVLLAAAGLGKVSRAADVPSVLAAARLPGGRRLPARAVNRVAGLAELAVGLLTLLVGGRIQGLLTAFAFGVLALLAARLVSVEAGQDCGCFARPSPITHWHTGVNLGFAIAGAVGALFPSGPLAGYLLGHPATGAAAAVAAALLAYLGYLLMTALPELLALVTEPAVSA
jgi:hypothetical protein